MMTTVHFIVKFVIAWLMRAWCKCFRSSEVVFLPWSVYVYRVVPAGRAALSLLLSCCTTIFLYTYSRRYCARRCLLELGHGIHHSCSVGLVSVLISVVLGVRDGKIAVIN